MASPPALTQISFAGGLDESMTDEVLDPSQAFRVLENTRQDYQGGANKRLGFDSLTRTRFTGGSRSTGARMASFRGSCCVVDGGSPPVLDVYDENYSLNNSVLYLQDCASDEVSLPRGKNESQVADVAIVNGVVLTAFKNNGYVTAANAETGIAVSIATVMKGTGTTNTLDVRLATFSSRYAAAFVQDTATGDIDVRFYDTTTRTWSAATAVAAGAATSSGAFSASSVSDRAIVAYCSGTNIVLKTYIASGIVSSQTIGIGAPNPAQVAIDVVGTTAWVAVQHGLNIDVGSFNTSTLASIAAYNFALLTTVNSATRIDIASKTDTTKARIYAMEGSTGSGTDLYFLDIKTTGATAVADGSSVIVHSVVPSSRMFRQGSRFYMAVHGSPASSTPGTSNRQRTLTVVDCTSNVQYMRPVAHVEPGLQAVCDGLTHWATDASGRACLAYGVLTRGTVTNTLSTSSDASAIKLLRLDFSSSLRWQSAEHDGALFFGGACTYVFDGEVAAEAGFLVAPNEPTSSTAAGSIPEGTYSYVVIYEYVGADGRVIYSGVSKAAAINTVGLGARDITIKFMPLTVTARSGLGLRAAVYRTGGTSGAAPYYRVGTKQNDTSVGLMSIVDSMLDAELLTQPQLYAPNLPQVDGDKLDRRAPVGAQCVAACNGVLVFSHGESIYCSGQSVYGEATWFNPLFELPLGIGAITALASLDGTLYAFSREGIVSVAVQPPSDNGTSGGLGTPRDIASTVGCISARSVVATSAGIFFQSGRGIELLNRGGEVEFVGYKVARTLSAYPVVSSAVLDARNSLVRFSLTTSFSAGLVAVGGRDVVFDLRTGTWVVDRKYGQQADEASQDAAVVSKSGTYRYAWLGRDGYVYVERLSTDASAYLDGSTWIARAAETGSFKTGGIQGQQAVSSVQLLERKVTDHNASIALAYNYESAFRTATTWASADINTVLTGGWPITQLRHLPHDDSQPCQGIRVRIADATPSTGTVGTGAASTWIAISLDITPKPGLFEVPEGLT